MITGHLSLSDIPAADRRETEYPVYQMTRSGYGSKLPTHHLIRLNGRWRRIYCCIWSNSGTAYVEINKNHDWLVITN